MSQWNSLRKLLFEGQAFRSLWGTLDSTTSASKLSMASALSKSAFAISQAALSMTMVDRSHYVIAAVHSDKRYKKMFLVMETKV